MRDLLSMDSGRQWSVFTDYVRLLAAPDRTAFAIGLRQSEAPGKVWAYNNSAEQTLDRVLQKATGQGRRGLRGAASLRPARHAPHGDDDRQGRQRADVRGHPIDLPRHGALRPADAGSGALGRPADRLAQLGASRPPGARRRSSTPATATSGGSTARASWPTSSAPRACRRCSAQPGSGASCPAPRARCTGRSGLGNQIVQVDPASKTVVVRLGNPNPLALQPTFGPAGTSEVVTRAVLRR